MEQPATTHQVEPYFRNPNMEANGDDSIIIVISDKASKPDRNADFCSARVLNLGFGWSWHRQEKSDKGEVCVPQLLTLPRVSQAPREHAGWHLRLNSHR